MIPEQYMLIARRWFWLIGLVTVATLAIAIFALPKLISDSAPGHNAAVTLGVSRLVSASGTVTTPGGTGTPELLTSYTQSIADRGSTPQFLKELQNQLATDGYTIDTGVLARKVDFKADTGLFRITITATDASSGTAQQIANDAADLLITDVTAEETSVRANLTTTTDEQQTELLAQLNDVYTQRTAELNKIGEPDIRTGLDDLVRNGVGQDLSQTYVNLVADLARLGNDPQLAVLNSEATSLEQQLGTLSDTQRSFSDQILQGAPLSVVDPVNTVQLAPANTLRTRDLALMGLIAGLVLGWIAAAVVDGYVAERRAAGARREEAEAPARAGIERYFSRD